MLRIHTCIHVPFIYYYFLFVLRIVVLHFFVKRNRILNQVIRSVSSSWLVHSTRASTSSSESLPLWSVEAMRPVHDHSSTGVTLYYLPLCALPSLYILLNSVTLFLRLSSLNRALCFAVGTLGLPYLSSTCLIMSSECIRHMSVTIVSLTHSFIFCSKSCCVRWSDSVWACLCVPSFSVE